MWLSVEHRTGFEYDAPIVEAHTELRLKPAHRAGQRCSSFAMDMEPRGASVDEHLDRFANCVHSFDVLDQHSELVVTARSEVWTPERTWTRGRARRRSTAGICCASRGTSPSTARSAALAG